MLFNMIKNPVELTTTIYDYKNLPGYDILSGYTRLYVTDAMPLRPLLG